MDISESFALKAFSRIFVGIDIGQKGGIALYGSKGNSEDLMVALPMPVMGSNEIDIAELKTILNKLHRIDLVIMEKVSARPGQGVSSMFKFGTSYGEIRGALKWGMIPYQLVTPQAWKKAILAGTKKDKDAAIAYVRNKWPSLSLHRTERSRTDSDGMADAVCLSEYASHIWNKALT
jgi:crossover junction endodeoxyribonuclease RuvC